MRIHVHFFQKPGNVHVVNYLAIAHLRGIKSTQKDT